MDPSENIAADNAKYLFKVDAITYMITIIVIGSIIIYFRISAIGFIVALFLPSILKIVPSTLGRLNNSLKRFVF